MAEEGMNRFSHMTVSDLMTSDPITIGPEVSLSRVMGLMREASIRHIPVVDEEGILGLVSDRDLTFIHGLSGVTDKLDADDIEALLQAPVSVVMKSRFLVERDVEVIESTAPLREAVDALVAAKIGALPVVDGEKNGELVGILSTVDVIRWTADEVL